MEQVAIPALSLSKGLITPKLNPSITLHSSLFTLHNSLFTLHYSLFTARSLGFHVFVFAFKNIEAGKFTFQRTIINRVFFRWF